MEAAEIIQEPVARDRTRALEFVLLSLAGVVALADFCLWRKNPGLSVGLLAAGITGIILINRPGMRWTRSAVIIVALLCGAAVESAIDLCFSNGLVLLVLILALAGETYYGTLRSGWSRWSEQIWTMAKTPGRWVWLLLEVGIESRKIGPMPPGALRKVARVLWIIVPGLVMTLLFAAILYNGNALFANLTGYWAAAVADWIARLHLSIYRFVFWGFVAWVALPLLRPSPAPKRPRPWSMEIPRLPEMTTARTARMQSAVMLGLLNALFCCVNTIDVVYLWARQKLPAGVNYSVFVHEGVASLILAALFSAVLLAGIFQQARTVSEWRPLRLLGLLWIGQNLMLLAGVVLRVKLYLDAFDLTVTRVNLVFFLALVAVGFVLLAIHVWRQHTLGWLLLANMMAAFFLFYAIQFLDTDEFVARYNVNLWRNAHDGRRLDVFYLERLGPAAFESIEKVAQSGAPEAAQATDYLKTARREAREQLDQRNWPSWQLRAMRSYRKLLMTTQP